MKKLIRRWLELSRWTESGQALAEYMPTIAGAMALSAIFAFLITGGVSNAYCMAVDALGDPPQVCEDGGMTIGGETGDDDDDGTVGDDDDGGTVGDDDDDGGTVGDDDDDGGTVGDDDDDGGTVGDDDDDGGSEEPEEASCEITISSADGTDPGQWNTPWDGNPDVLTVSVDALDGPLTWSLKLRFPTDPDSVDTEIASGDITETGAFDITVNYPPEGEWGPVSEDGLGTYESHATLHITEPCGDVGWDRWYKANWEADLVIDIEHDVSPVTYNGETLTYTVEVFNDGPNNTQIFEGQGTIVNLPVPTNVSVVSVTPSQGTCDTQIVCDLGELPYLATATIEVVTTVENVAQCQLDGESDVAAPRPPDPDMSNNYDITIPFCELTCEQQVTSFTLFDAGTDVAIGELQNGDEITLGAGDSISVVANVSGSVGSVRFWVNGVYERNENVAPYAIAGDSSGNYAPWNVSPGTYTIVAKPFTQSNGNGDNCSQYEVTITIIEEETGDDDDDGGVDDPDQPTGDPYATCPTSHPTKIAGFDHYATPEDYTPALKWCNGCSRQSHTYEFTLDGDYDTLLVMRGAVGHPEIGCPDAPHSFCSQPNQDNEHWQVLIDGEFVALNLDNYALDHVYLNHPDAPLGVVAAGTHSITMEHAGLLDMPTNSTGPSVGAYVSICVNDGGEGGTGGEDIGGVDEPTIVTDTAADEEGWYHATCPEAYPNKIVEFDRMNTVETPSHIIWKNNYNHPKQTHTGSFTLDDNYELVMVVMQIVGHPEFDCPEGDHLYCTWEDQLNEHFNVLIDGGQEYYASDQPFDHQVVQHPNTYLGMMGAGEHELVITHAGNPNPKNSNGPSVGALVAICATSGGF